MLWPEASLRPSISGVEFDTQKISDFAKNTVFYPAHQFSARIGDPNRASLVEPDAPPAGTPRKRNIFQVRHTPPVAVVLVPPLNVHQIRTQHPGFDAPIQHSIYQFVIGLKDGFVNPSALHKIALIVS